MPALPVTLLTLIVDNAEQAADVADLRAAIHRATAGRASRDDSQRRQDFGDGLQVCESSMSRWSALWQAPTAPMPL